MSEKKRSLADEIDWRLDDYAYGAVRKLVPEVRALEAEADDREKYNADGWEAADLECERLRWERDRLRAFARRFADQFESDFVIGNLIVDGPGELWGPLVPLWEAACGALNDTGAGADSTTSGTPPAPGSSESASPAPPTSEADR